MTLNERGPVMKRNVGSIDKMLRITAGVVIIALGVYFRTWWGLVGIVPLVTGIAGTCPLYSLLGMSTCHNPEGTAAGAK